MFYFKVVLSLLLSLMWFVGGRKRLLFIGWSERIENTDISTCSLSAS